nr:hypothetical protein CFP56_57206 [Quercus suber]
MRRQEHPSKRFVHKARPSHGEVVQANGVDTRPYLLRAEEQGRGIVKKARPSEHPSKRFVHKARPSHGEVVQANGVDTRPYLLRAEEQGRGIVKKARPSVRMDEPSS